MQFNLKKLFDLDLKKLGPPSWARINLMILVDLDLKSARSTLLEFELNLCYIGVGLEKHLNYLTGLGLILLYIGLRLIE